jgi:2'-5' RNA ligase
VTLARLPERFPDRGRLEQAVALRGAYVAPRFIVEDFRLFRSHLAAAGAAYEELARYPLG